MNIIDDTPQPGSLNFVPADPEIPVVSIAPSIETAPPVETKVETAQENEPIYTIPQAKPAEPKQEATPVIIPTLIPVEPKVVDKSNELTKTHHLQNTHDKLTALADSDEEKFIEEVEAAHGHK